MFDLVIRGERVVTPQGVEPREIAVKDGVIAALAAPGTFPAAQAARVIEAGNAVVIPGGIDPHIHCAWYIPPMRPGDPPVSSAGPEQVSRAALMGRHDDADRLRRLPAGRATILQEERARRDRGARQGLERQMLLRLCVPRDAAAARSPPATIAQLPEAIQAGYPTIKIFMTNIRPAAHGPQDRHRRHLGDLQGARAQGRGSRRSTPRKTTS